MSRFTDAVEQGLKGLHAVSTGVCPGCETCADRYGFDLADTASAQAFRDAWERCTLIEESRFSWRACDICDTQLGGDRDIAHALDADNEILHLDSVCVDCVLYLANGDQPDRWKRRSTDED